MDVTQKTNPADDRVDIGISKDNRSKVVEVLTQLLADEHILYIKLRNYHWNVEGMFFAPLHELFEEQYEDLAKRIDEIAERIRSLGSYSPGSLAAFKQIARLQETDHLGGDAVKMLQNILLDHEMVIRVLREGVVTCEQHKDAGTADILTALMEDHEKMAWMVRSHLA
ncbi:MAG: DNA starvation/stationary phase protection protein [Bacteroidota bacterium]